MSTTTEDGVAVSVEGLSKRYRVYDERNQSLKATVMRRGRARFREFWALREVDLTVPAGITCGLIGENGSGKSTLLKCMARILEPDEGQVVVAGSLAALLELGAGFHPELSGRENVFLNGVLLGLSQRDLEERFDDIVSFAGLEDFIDAPVKTYSSGMYVRLGFSIAINVDPDVLLVDEVLAVGDEQFQRKCSDKFADLKHAGKTIVLVSHALGNVRSLCDEVVLLDHGRVVTTGDPSDVIDRYVDDLHQSASRVGATAGRGAPDATISSVELLDRHGRLVGRVRTGEPCTIRVHYRSEDPVRRPVWGLVVERVDGVIVAAPTTVASDIEPDEVRGAGHVDYTIDGLGLLPGTYEIGAALFDLRLSRSFDQRDRILRFHVDPGRPHEHDGIVTLGGRWEGAALDVATRSER